MRTVKEMSELTGVSIRTLRYYDEIGLLKPTELTKAGYRLYEMSALDNERSILLDLAKEYLQYSKLAEVTDSQFGAGCSEYVANAIKRYYGV